MGHCKNRKINGSLMHDNELEMRIWICETGMTTFPRHDNMRWIDEEGSSQDQRAKS